MRGEECEKLEEKKELEGEKVEEENERKGER